MIQRNGRVKPYHYPEFKCLDPVYLEEKKQYPVHKNGYPKRKECVGSNPCHAEHKYVRDYSPYCFFMVKKQESKSYKNVILEFHTQCPEYLVDPHFIFEERDKISEMQ